MKIIIRADDVGYTDVCNIGAFKTMEEGVVTSADVMLDTPGTIDALERLKSFPWISIGWHAHFWGSPVLGKDKVPSMFDPSRNGFRKDLSMAEDVVFEEALAECRAEIELCVKILGRAPDTGGFGRGNSPMARAMQQVEKEYGIVTNFNCNNPLMGENSFFGKRNPDPKWADRKICSGSFAAFADLETDSISALEKYNPITYYTEDKGNLLKMPDDYIVMNAWHPGYVDYFVYKCGDYGPNAKKYIEIRTVDVHALCSQEVKDWIIANKIELVNTRDALYGTQEYQNHLRAIGSPLAIK